MSKRILVIEDEPEFRGVLADVLEQEGYQVRDQPLLATAIGEALTGEFDLITLDLRLPQIDGLEVAALFRRSDLQTPVLVMSGYLTDRISEKLQELGIHHIVPKPLSVGQILHAVDAALNGPSESNGRANGTSRNGHSSAPIG